MTEYKKSGTNFWLILIIAVVVVGLFGTFIVFMFAGAVAAMSGQGQLTGHPKYQARVLEGSGQDKILLLKIEGIIGENKFLGNSVGETPERLRAKLKQASSDKSIKAVLIKIKSPGGTVTASDSINRYIREFREETGIPVVVYLDTLAASGGYYVAVAGDKIISHPTTIVGSIGVIMQFFQINDLLQNKLGVKAVVIKSGPHKDIASGFRDPRPEEEKILHEMLMEMYQRFLTVIKEGRPNIERGLAEKKLYLFSISPATAFRPDLEKGVVSKDLKNKFTESGNALADNAILKRQAQGSWLLEDNENQYFLTLKNDSIDIQYQASLKRVADGRIYTANQALDLGLIDGIGYFTDAVKKAKTLGKIGGDYQLMTYQRPKSLIELIIEPSAKASGLPREFAKNLISRLSTPGIYYLWNASD